MYFILFHTTDSRPLPIINESQMCNWYQGYRWR